MSDGTISAVPPSPPQPAQQAAPVVVKVVALPPNIQPNTVISGQVIANQNNQVSIQTDQGVVVLQGTLNVDVGQNINLKIQPLPQQPVLPSIQPLPVQSQPVQQQATQPITQNYIAELLNVSADNVAQVNTGSVQPTQIETAQPVANQPPADPVIVRDANAYEEYKPLQALILQMPDTLNNETLNVLVKSVLQLPIQQPLPPSLQEGFAKFDQLVDLLSQANLFPANAAETGNTQPGIQQNIVSMLQQLLQPVAGKNMADNPLLIQEPHQFIQLQTIQPGENLSPNILVNIKEQLANLLQSQPAQLALPSEKPAGLLQSLIPNALTSLMGKASDALQSNLPEILTPPPASTAVAKPQNLFTLPAIGLVLGQPPHDVPQLDKANLVLMTTPLKQDAQPGKTAPQQLIALLAPQEENAPAPLLPGSIIVAALKPQAQQTTSFTVLPQELLPQIIETFARLHPSLGDNWPALDDLWQQVLNQGATQPALQNAVHQMIPTPSPQQLPPTMLFFLSVLKNDFLSQWMPESRLAGLENIDKASLIKALTSDLQTIKSRMEDAAPDDTWRPLPLPLQVGDQLLRLQWFYRHPQDNYERPSGEQDDTIQKKNKTRFLVNVPKTFVGDLQIDGLVQERNLDIILRTENMLASHMETAIRGRYTAALETTGMIGGISFQSGRDHYVHV
jgi:hypothetical protein